VERLDAADLILHAGDFVSLAFFEELERLGPPVAGVYGNMDEPALRERLPHNRIVEAGAARIGMVHIPGPRARREERLVARFAGCDAVVYGHTHVPQVEHYDGVWILNPGSPTERRSAPAHSMLVLRIDGQSVEPELVPLP
jgi:putative phosphoesterase